jgi:hypothetical protein
MMQNSKVVERFTAHYVFCLGLSRFFSCAHWILQLLEGNKYLLHALGSGLWPVLVLLSEIVQTFILADFWCVPRQEGGSASWSHAVAGRLLPSLASCAASSSGAWAGCHVLFQIRKMPCWTTPSTCVLACATADTACQCFLLVCSCSWYYVKSYAEGSGIVRLPAGIV